MCNCGQCCESEETNNFWADVYYHMETHAVDEETAVKAIKELYENLK